jgi:hypothetical protein
MICRFCGKESDQMTPFDEWIKPTFVDHDKLLPGDAVCDDCLFWFNERSENLARLVGKDKPQRMRNYSHFIVADEWIPLSKANKQRMQDLLFGNPFPELAAIAESGQKHIVFRARRNLPGSICGWIQFEEQAYFLQPNDLWKLLDLIELLYAHFSKTEIRTADYKQHRVRKFGMAEWWALESGIKDRRGSLLFQLALFLAQRRENDIRTRKGSGTSVHDLAGSAKRLQESLPDDNMETVRGSDTQRGVYEQLGDVRQLSLFES